MRKATLNARSAWTQGFGAAWKTDGAVGFEAEWIVTEANGAVVHPDTLLGRWKRLVRTAGVTEIGLHGARHSYAELAFGAGVRLDVVSRTLGHASAAFTADQYAHDNDDAAAEAAEIIGRTLRTGGLTELGRTLGECEGAGITGPLRFRL